MKPTLLNQRISALASSFDVIWCLTLPRSSHTWLLGGLGKSNSIADVNIGALKNLGENMLNDFRGIEILVGDVIAYPGRKGSSLWLSFGRVTYVFESGELSVRTSNDKDVTLLRSDRVAVLDRAV